MSGWVGGFALIAAAGCAPPESVSQHILQHDVYDDLDGDGLADAAALYRMSRDGEERMWLSFSTGFELLADEDNWYDETPLAIGAKILGVVDLGDTPTLVIRDAEGLMLAHWNGERLELRPSEAQLTVSAHGTWRYGQSAPERWIAVYEKDYGFGDYPTRAQVIRAAGDDIEVGPPVDPDTLPPTRDELGPTGDSLHLDPEAGRPVAWADFDGDGDLDVFSQRTDRRTDSVTLEESSQVFGYISFARGKRWSKAISTHWPHLGGVADFDGDGVTEVVVHGAGSAYLYSFRE